MPGELEDLHALQGLTDPVRRALYRHVIAEGKDVSREAAARAVGISRSLAAYHLDRLVDDGLLECHYERLSGRRGPGAGRPSKLYARSAARIQVSVPPRDYELAARLLAGAVETDESARVAVARTARALGQRIGREATRRDVGESSSDAMDCLLRALDERGYEPYEDGGAIRLRNCPFEALTAQHRDLVCGMNLALIEGAADELGDAAICARLDPRPGECCVAIEAVP